MLDVPTLIQEVSVFGALAVIALIVFAESGLLIGLFLPGDTLLVTAGFLAAQGTLPLGSTLAVIFIGSVVGDNVGYFIGQKAGSHFFRKRDGIFFRREYMERANNFYARHGGKAVLFARFVPYVRTFAPMVAGAANMRRGKFVIYDLIGAGLWTATFVMVGYVLGVEVAEQVERYVLPAFLVCIAFALSPSIIFVIRNERFRAYVLQRLRYYFRKKQ